MHIRVKHVGASSTGHGHERLVKRGTDLAGGAEDGNARESSGQAETLLLFALDVLGYLVFRMKQVLDANSFLCFSADFSRLEVLAIVLLQSPNEW